MADIDLTAAVQFLISTGEADRLARVLALAAADVPPSRDQLAAMAMQGILADGTTMFTNESLARSAYEVADAMLAERERRTPSPEPTT